MYGLQLCTFSIWWIVPIIMMALCFLMMRGRRGSMMCGFGPRTTDCQQTKASDSVKDILDRRYASGEIDEDEYEEKKRILTDSMDLRNE